MCASLPRFSLIDARLLRVQVSTHPDFRSRGYAKLMAQVLSDSLFAC